MTDTRKSVKHLLDLRLDPEEMAAEYAMDISASVYRRMKELGIKKKELATRLGVSPARVSRILSGEQKMTLKTIAKLEEALDFDIAYGFRNPKPTMEEEYKALLRDYEPNRWMPDKRVGAKPVDFTVGALA